MVSASVSPFRRVVLLLYFCCLCSVVVSDDIAYWVSPRADLVDQSIYVDGGNLFNGTYVDGAFENAMRRKPAGGMLYRLNLTLPYTNIQNMNNLDHVDYTNDPEYALYIAGAMFVNYDGLMTYGGLPIGNVTPSENTTLSCILASPSGAEGFIPGCGLATVTEQQLTSNTESSRMWNRCCGASVSVPSENLAFYFGGLGASDGGPISYETIEGYPDVANTTLNDLIMCNTTDIRRPLCEKLSVPSNLGARAEAEMIWLPYGDQGCLVILGGVAMPGDMYSGIVQDPSLDYSNSWTSNLVIFDIASGNWTTQTTVLTSSSMSNPGQRASFCSVVATSADNKSHHIYVYGGYDGTYLTSAGMAAFDDVWVLSVPAFRWTKVSDGTDNHRRQNHRCVKTSPSQFFSIGGSAEYGMSLLTNSAIDVFDMNALTWNSLMWNSSYDPKVWSDYIIPTVVSNSFDVNTIPGDLEPAVIRLLGNTYKGTVRKLVQYEDLSPKDLSLKGSLKLKDASRWLAITTVVLGYLTVASCALMSIVILRRRLIYRSANIDMSTMTSKHYVVRWMHDVPIKVPDSYEKAGVTSSLNQRKVSISENYVDEDQSAYEATPSSHGKLIGTQVRSYERLDVDLGDDIELTTLTETSQARTM